MPDIEQTLSGKRILLIIGGGIAAYKSLDLIRRLRERGASVKAILTKAGEEFVTPLSVSSLTGDKVYRDLFDLTDEAEMGHIQLSRDGELLVVAPATADLLAKMTHGLANDLASTAILATDKPVLVAPAMNVRMWQHPATQRNMETLKADGVRFVGPNDGDMACGEFGPGRMAEPLEIVTAVEQHFAVNPGPLTGKHVVVTSGPTHEPIDPVRYIANRSSGKQGMAIACALRDLGASVTLISGPTNLADPKGVETIHIESARELLNAATNALPADAVICTAAVADFRVDGEADQKIKKTKDGVPTLSLVENPDILKTISQMTNGRPRLVIGFAAETETVVDYASAKRLRKGCDWIVANDVSEGTGIMGGDHNKVHLITSDGQDDWPHMSKDDVAQKLAQRIAEELKDLP